MTTITVIAKDIQTSLLKERKKLEEARTSTQTPTSESRTPRMAEVLSWPTTTRVADRIKRIWNEDIEKSVRRLQKTDWEKVGSAVQSHMKRARERMATSLERMGEDSKKST